MSALLVAVDVGTGSARAGVLDAVGRLQGRAEHPVRTLQTAPGFAEQDSEEIWRAVCTAVRSAIRMAAATPPQIKGISFDATCSLVVRDRRGQPLGVSETGDDRWDTIAWRDHRSLAEAEECTATGHAALDSVGGVMSPEMQLPKVMWLKRNFARTWARVGYLFDLTDYLAWRACGSAQRSSCTLTCKWNYRGHPPVGWDMGFLDRIGLADLVERGSMPEHATPPGEDLGPLTAAAAADLGLGPDCRVGAGLIDAHAGALGMLGGALLERGECDTAALIAGTSSCVMTLSGSPVVGSGIWGPCLGPVLPGIWLSEGGQSATGALLDHVIRTHPAGGEPTGVRHGQIMAHIERLRGLHGEDFAAGLHLLPDYRGNRSPLADPRSCGMVVGLTADDSFDGLCRLYWRAAVALALGTRQILEHFSGQGMVIRTLHAAGGLSRIPELMSLYADCTGREIVEYPGDDPILLGTAMAAASAARLHPDLPSAAVHMARQGMARAPDPDAVARYDRDYRVFRTMQEQRAELERLFRSTG